MDTDGMNGGHGRSQDHGGHGAPPETAAGPHVPHPAGPLPSLPPRPTRAPLLPPPPAHAPGATPGTPAADGIAGPVGNPFTAWLRTPRPETEPGYWRLGHTPVAPKAAGTVRSQLVRVVVSFLVFFVCWQAFREGKLPFLGAPLYYFTPDSWWEGAAVKTAIDHRGLAAVEFYELLGTVGLFLGFAKLGGWRTAFDDLIAARGPWYRAAGAAAAAFVTFLLIQNQVLTVYPLAFGHLPYTELTGLAGALVIYLVYTLIYLPLVPVFARLGGWTSLLAPLRTPARPADAPPSPIEGGPDDPVAWPQLRAAGMAESAERLASEAAAGRMNDVDHVRIRRAWDSVLVDPLRRTAFAKAVRDQGAAACGHPSGARDLPARAARHDLVVAQVRLGSVTDAEPNPHERRGTGFALDPGVLGTSMLAVGPSGAGKTGRLVRPVVESLMLQALAGEAAVIVVAAAGTHLGPDDAYDIVVRLGDPSSVHDLDLYGGVTDPDEAASLLAEAFVGDIPGIDVRRSATALAQLLGPFRVTYGRFPTVPELRELLEGLPSALGALRQALESADHQTMLRELDARIRQSGVQGDPGPVLADRVALLDRPAFQGFFDTTGSGRPFSLRALEHPIRVRVDLPERAHADASRLLARLLLAQFNGSAAARGDRSLFAFLALDDASHTLTPETVRGVQRLRSANAGVLLSLRTLDDVPEPLRTPLLGSVGCRVAFSGVTTWDGKWFADAWGTELVETRDVTSRTVYADQPMTRFIHSVRKLITGKAVTTDAVTVRQVERERWSASALANTVPPGHAVLSLTSVRGERVAPLLVRFGE
ncbi:ATP/GTP-binding protein [Streptomyces virginiae]|uniref:ATP/GTP-binding protein n=1 Tax=Streptomyces virginiae TaxID=1961 RepID=UPI00381E698E